MKVLNFLEHVGAIRNSKALAPFLDGVTATLPSVGRVTLKVTASRVLERPAEFRFHVHSAKSVIESDTGHFAAGYGEADSKLLAIQKSIVEGVERTVFRILKDTEHGSRTSNGWAARGSPL